jgi:hypothetical protein
MTNQKTSRELVKAGHALANTFGTDSPLLEVAKLISDISTRLDVAVVRGNELQQKLDAVVAEAAYLRDEIKTHSQSTHFCEVCGKDDPCKNDDVCWSLKHPMPATDAILNAVRAEGAEMFGNLTIKIGEDEKDDSIIYAGKQALLFANKLRAGDADKAGE